MKAVQGMGTRLNCTPQALTRAIHRVLMTDLSSPNAVGVALGIKLRENGDRPRSPLFTPAGMTFFAGSSVKGPVQFAELSVREDHAMLELIPPREPVLKERDISREGYGAATIGGSPSAGPEGTRTYAYQVRNVFIVFEFTSRTLRLTRVTMRSGAETPDA
jgi:hypothetical protein